MDRREVLKSMSLVLGYSLTPAAVNMLLTSCAKRGTVDWTPKYFTEKEAYAVEQLAEVFLPKTDTPGAKDVNAVSFIDTYISGILEKEDQDKFKTGLTNWISRFEEKTKDEIAYAKIEDFEENLKSYFDIDEEKQAEIKELLRTSEEDNKNEDYYIYSFLFTVKKLAMLGFYASEEIGENVLSYLPIPGNYQGCIPAEQVGNAWSL